MLVGACVDAYGVVSDASFVLGFVTYCWECVFRLREMFQRFIAGRRRVGRYQMRVNS